MSTTHPTDDIRAAAKAYNAEYPEAAAEIDAGTPVVRVFVSHGVKDPRRVTVSRHVGIVAPDGGFIAACEPEALVTDLPRYGAAKLGEWFGRKAGLGVRVEVTVR